MKTLPNISTDIQMLNDLSKTQRCYDDLIQNCTTAIAIYQAVDNGKDFIFKDFNPKAEAYEGVKKQDVIGKRVTEVFPGVVEFGLLDVFREVLKTEQSRSFPIKLYSDGRIQGWRENFVFKNGADEIVAVYSDETWKKQAEEELKRSEFKYRALTELTPVGIFEADTQGNCCYANSMTFKLFEVENSDELIGQKWTKYIHPEDLGLVAEQWDKAVENKTIFKAVYRLITKRMKVIWAKTEFHPHLNIKDGKEDLTFLGSIVDITEQKTIEANLRDSKTLTENAREMQAQFIAQMGHEIRTPMNAILGMTEVLEEILDTKEQKKYLKVIKGAGEALLYLINDILDLSKMESGEFTIEDGPFNFNDILSETLEIMEIKAIEKNIQLITDVPEILNLTTLIGDGARIRQVLINLLSNAIKFTETGFVKIAIESSETLDNGRLSFRVTVEDTGIGIASQDFQDVFDKFKQVDSGLTRSYKGTGLGLSISKKLIEAMGGKIGILKSTVNKGSTFYFDLELECIQFIDNSKEAEKSYTHFYSKKFLIVDEDDSNAEELKKIIYKNQGNYLRVKSWNEAKEVLFDGKYGQVFFDYLVINCYSQNSNFCGWCEIVNEVSTRFPYLETFLISPEENCNFQGRDKLPCNLRRPLSIADFIQEVALMKRTPCDKVFDINHRYKILVTDDASENRLLIGKYLEKGNYDLDMAVNGKDALEKVKSNKYDLILIDVQMPIMDGLTAIKHIREYEGKRSHTPIITLTAHAYKEDIERSLMAGSDYHLTKPIKKQVLRETIESFICKSTSNN